MVKSIAYRPALTNDHIKQTHKPFPLPNVGEDKGGYKPGTMVTE